MKTIPWATVEAALNDLRAQNSHDIVLRRNGTPLPAQNVRVERSGTQARWQKSISAERAEESVVIVGAPALDIMVKDRFTLESVVYEVNFIHPLRLACTQADATAVE